VEIARIDEIFPRRIPAADELVIVDHSTKWRLEDTVDRGPERADDLIEDVERNVGCPALDVGNGLARDAGRLGESGLRYAGAGSGDDEVAAQYLSRWGPLDRLD
jgi:hypothetical protein